MSIILLSLSLLAEKYQSNELYEVTGHQLNRQGELFEAEVEKVVEIKREYSNALVVHEMITNNYEYRMYIMEDTKRLELRRERAKARKEGVLWFGLGAATVALIAALVKYTIN